MNDQPTSAPTEAVLAEGAPARSSEAPDRNELRETPLAPVPTLLMMSGDDAGLCTGDACAIPLTTRKAE